MFLFNGLLAFVGLGIMDIAFPCAQQIARRSFYSTVGEYHSLFM